MIGLNPFLDSLCNFGFKNGGLHPRGDIASRLLGNSENCCLSPYTSNGVEDITL